MARLCERCQIKMPAFRPRMRDAEGKLVCSGCHPDGMGGEGRPVGLHGSKTGADMGTCEDCEMAPAVVERIANDGQPIKLCAGCDPGPGCRPVVKRDRYSNGSPMYWAECPQCGWKMDGTADSESTAKSAADRHRAENPARFGSLDVEGFLTSASADELGYFLQGVNPVLAAQWRSQPSGLNFWAWVVTLPSEQQAAIQQAAGAWMRQGSLETEAALPVKDRITSDQMRQARDLFGSLRPGDQVVVVMDGRESTMGVMGNVRPGDLAIAPGGGYEPAGSGNYSNIQVGYGPGRFSTSITLTQQANGAAGRGGTYIKGKAEPKAAQVTHEELSGYWGMPMAAALTPGLCPRCRGRGRTGYGGGAHTCWTCKGTGKAPKQSALQVEAHDSGDGETIYHCPFCGGGQVTGRSDGSIECDFCDTAFTVQVQPKKSGQPQTFNGQPMEMPGMPGQRGGEPTGGDPTDPNAPPQPGGQPADINAEFQVLLGQGGESDDEEGSGNPVPPQFQKGSSFYLGADGSVRDEETFVRHLAVRYADDRDEVLRSLREENRGESSRRP